MTQSRFDEIKETLDAAWRSDGEIDLFDPRPLTSIPRPLYDAARASLSPQERAEFDAIREERCPA